MSWKLAILTDVVKLIVLEYYCAMLTPLGQGGQSVENVPRFQFLRTRWVKGFSHATLVSEDSLPDSRSKNPLHCI